MILRIDCKLTPPRVDLLEADDLTSFKTIVVVGRHSWVAPATLEALGPSTDPAWRKGLSSMVEFAAEHGWTDERGRVRSHVELVEERPAET
ncbi:MAG: hypothetical protein JST59_28765 [Actinobacteria bacterium]|nr:hypothetical protein [Actinomycetota bacterium]